MEEQRFDTLTKVLGSSKTRRRVQLGVLVGAVTGTLAQLDAEAKRKRHTAKHEHRHKHRQDSQRKKRQIETAKKDCRPAGRPCEGNQACCDGLVCAVSGPGSAQRCIPCTPGTCPERACGLIPDECGGTLNCGSCTAPQTCGGGGT